MPKKTTMKYLEERRDMAAHNLLCYSETYGMNSPNPGMEEQFAEAWQDLEIVDYLIALVANQEEKSLSRIEYERMAREALASAKKRSGEERGLVHISQGVLDSFK